MAMTAPLELAAADPVSANQAARKSYVDAAPNAAAAAAAAAQSTANAAAASAATNAGNITTLFGRITGKIRWGVTSGATNGAGDIAIPHGLGQTPAVLVVTPINNGANMTWHGVVQNLGDATNSSVRVHNTNTGAVLASSGVTFAWFAAA